MNRKIIMALLLSMFLCPGLGQYWLGHKKRGIWFVSIINLIAIVWTFVITKLTHAKLSLSTWHLDQVNHQYIETFSDIAANNNQIIATLCVILIGLIWCLAIIDTYIVAKGGKIY